jgi:hypothetical protein
MNQATPWKSTTRNPYRRRNFVFGCIGATWIMGQVAFGLVAWLDPYRPPRFLRSHILMYTANGSPIFLCPLCHGRSWHSDFEHCIHCHDQGMVPVPWEMVEEDEATR